MDVISAVAAGFAAISAGASAYTGIKMRQDVKLSEASARYALVRSFEGDYAQQYDAIWGAFGPWRDPIEVDPAKRRAVHDVLVTLSSIYNARQEGLIDDVQSRYLGTLFADWLHGSPEAHSIWRQVFNTPEQADTWPAGFSRFVQDLVGAADRGPSDPDAPRV